MAGSDMLAAGPESSSFTRKAEAEHEQPHANSMKCTHREL